MVFYILRFLDIKYIATTIATIIKIINNTSTELGIENPKTFEEA